MTAVHIEGLEKRFGDTRAIDGVNLDIAEGELVSFLGPSGCGKTTTLRCIAGFENPTAGRILFDGRDQVGLPPERRNIGMVFQNYALFPHMTVKQNLAFGLEMRKIKGAEADRRIADVLETVQLGGLQDRYPRQLSGGQQQRVALARALVIEPSILLLDEPLANLDAKLRDEMRFFIRSLQKRVGITTVYVTHDQAEAMVISDRIIVMFGGRIAQSGGPTDIYRRPANRQVADFIGLSNFIEGRVKAANGQGLGIVDTPLGELHCPLPAGMDAGARVLTVVRPESIGLHAAPPVGGANGFAAVVSERYFLGNMLDYKLAAGGRTIQVQAQPGETAFEPGANVWCAVSAQQAWTIPEA